jgi:hypothetical protein
LYGPNSETSSSHGDSGIQSAHASYSRATATKQQQLDQQQQQAAQQQQQQQQMAAARSSSSKGLSEFFSKGLLTANWKLLSKSSQQVP